MLDSSYAFPVINLGLRPMTSSSMGLPKENGKSYCINVGGNTVIFIILHLFKMQSQMARIEHLLKWLELNIINIPLYFISNKIRFQKQLLLTNFQLLYLNVRFF